MLDFNVRCGAIPTAPNMRKVPNETTPVRNVTSGRKRLKSLFVTDCCTPVAICPTRCCAAGQKKKHPPMHNSSPAFAGEETRPQTPSVCLAAQEGGNIEKIVFLARPGPFLGFERGQARRRRAGWRRRRRARRLRGGRGARPPPGGSRAPARLRSPARSGWAPGRGRAAGFHAPPLAGPPVG